MFEHLFPSQMETRKVYNLFQDLWNRFIILEGGCKVPLVPRPCMVTGVGGAICLIRPNFYVVWTLFTGFCGQGVHFWGKNKRKAQKIKIHKKGDLPRFMLNRGGFVSWGF